MLSGKYSFTPQQLSVIDRFAKLRYLYLKNLTKQHGFFPKLANMLSLPPFSQATLFHRTTYTQHEKGRLSCSCSFQVVFVQLNKNNTCSSHMDSNQQEYYSPKMGCAYYHGPLSKRCFPSQQCFHSTSIITNKIDQTFFQHFTRNNLKNTVDDLLMNNIWILPTTWDK